VSTFDVCLKDFLALGLGREDSSSNFSMRSWWDSADLLDSVVVCSVQSSMDDAFLHTVDKRKFYSPFILNKFTTFFKKCFKFQGQVE